LDYGARMMTAIASVIDCEDPDEVDKILDTIVDPAGSFYRFSLAHSMLRTGQVLWNDN
jgi:F420-non-reducing hydrogenase small subunit